MNQLIPLLEKVFATLLKQAEVAVQTNKLGMTIALIVGGLLVIGIAVCVYRAITKSEEGCAIGAVCAGLFLVLDIVVYTICYSSYLTALNNPAYWAIKKIAAKFFL